MGKKISNSIKCCVLFLMVIVNSAQISERHTKLLIEGGNPPEFIMTGSGALSSIRISGPQKQRDAEGEEMYLYWVIKYKARGEARAVEGLGPIVYGRIPEGYLQKYPEKGEAPKLVEGERYFIRVTTFNANGVEKYFVIRNSKVEVSDY
jgi:hypothetical protein